MCVFTSSKKSTLKEMHLVISYKNDPSCTLGKCHHPQDYTLFKLWIVMTSILKQNEISLDIVCLARLEVLHFLVEGNCILYSQIYNACTIRLFILKYLQVHSHWSAKLRGHSWAFEYLYTCIIRIHTYSFDKGHITI